MLDTAANWPANARDPYTLYARFVGTGASAPTPVANTTRPTGPGTSDQGGGPISIVRNGTGNVTVTFPRPTGTVQFYSAQVMCASADVNCRVTPPTTSQPLTLTVVMTFQTNGTARDLTSSDELLIEVTGSLAIRP